MAPKPFSDRTVISLRGDKSRTKWREVADGGCRGLSIRISPTGEKVWAVRVNINGKRVRHILGGYPSVSLAAARQRAVEFMAAARDGRSPEETEARLRARTMTVAAAHKEYLETIQDVIRSSTRKTKEQVFRLHINPLVGGRPVRSIRRPDLVSLVTRVAAKGFRTQANRVYSEMMAFLRWCEEKDYVDGVPALRRRSLRAFGAAREAPRDRALSDDELALVWKKSADLGPRTSVFIRLLLLTGQRRDEVRLMTWDELDMQRAQWKIPAHRYKTCVPHLLPLSKPVMDILRARWSKGAKGYVICGRKPDDPFMGHASALRRLQSAMGDYAPFTLHDLRRTVRTGLSALGVDADTAERVIGHLPQGIRKVYDMYERLPERRRALEVWAEHVLLLSHEGKRISAEEDASSGVEKSEYRG